MCVVLVQLDQAVFFDRINQTVELKHIIEGLVKSSVFGIIFALICSFKGYHTTGGAKGVGEATNRGVVISMVMIIVLDYFLTNLLRMYYLVTGDVG